MVLEHLGSGMTLRELVPAAGTAGGDIVLSVPQHPIPAEAVLKPSQSWVRNGPSWRPGSSKSTSLGMERPCRPSKAPETYPKA